MFNERALVIVFSFRACLSHIYFLIVSVFRHNTHGVNSQSSFCQSSIEIHSKKARIIFTSYEKQRILFHRTNVQQSINKPIKHQCLFTSKQARRSTYTRTQRNSLLQSLSASFIFLAFSFRAALKNILNQNSCSSSCGKCISYVKSFKYYKMVNCARILLLDVIYFRFHFPYFQHLVHSCHHCAFVARWLDINFLF